MLLTIPESLLLLSRKNETGEKQGQFVEYALAGGAIADLMLRGRLEPVPDKPKKMQVRDGTSTGDRFLDGCLNAIQRIGSGKDISRYVSKLASKSRLMREQAASLVDRGVLREKERSFLVFSWTNYPEADGSVEANLVAHLARVMFEGQEPSAEDCVAVALAEKTGLLNRNFDKKLLREHKARLKEIKEGSLEPAKATLKAIDAVLVAIIAASTVTTAATAS